MYSTSTGEEKREAPVPPQIYIGNLYKYYNNIIVCICTCTTV